MKQKLQSLFYAKEVALFGATNKKEKIAYQIAKNLKKYKQGKVFYINPKLARNNKKLFNKKVYSDCLNIPLKKIDLAVIAIPSKYVVQVIEDLAKKNCKNIVLITSGFNEIGNHKEAKKLKHIISKHKINLIGPNCLGILNLHNNLDTTFNSNKLIYPVSGNISIISQSGALGTAILDKSSLDDLAINKFVSYGNAIDINACDILEYLCKDKTTDIVLCYIEGLKNGKRFYEILKKYSSKKKIIILKGGRSNKGSLAAKSHTAAISGSYKVFSAAIKQAGGYLVDSVEDLFYIAKLFSLSKNTKIKNTQIITNGGGIGVLTADQISRSKIQLSKLSKKSKEKIREQVPKYATINNPLDLTGDASPKRFEKIINICLKDKKIHSICLLILFQLPSIKEQEFVDVIAKVNKNTNKPIFLISIGGLDTNKNIKKLEDKEVLCFRDPKHLGNILSLVY